MIHNTTSQPQQLNPYDRIAMFQVKTINQTSFTYVKEIQQVDSIKTGKKWIQTEKYK